MKQSGHKAAAVYYGYTYESMNKGMSHKANNDYKASIGNLLYEP